jgi:hypothetical protein
MDDADYNPTTRRMRRWRWQTPDQIAQEKTRAR